MASLLEKSVNKAKPVIMLVIDTLMDPPLQEAIKNNRAPALKFLMDNGKYYPDMVSSFPTMSVNVDTTILTGTYCNDHHLPGLVWFNEKENRLINYGSHIRELWKLGLSRSIEDILYNMNGSHIRELWKLGLSRSIEDILYNMNGSHISKGVKTIHEVLEDKGKDSASINALVYRGNISQYYKLPKLLTWFTSLRKDRPTFSAKEFTYGLLKKISPSKKYSRLWQRFGFNNSHSVNELTHLIYKDELPPFTIVYFPELDQSVHKHGRMDVNGIEKVDQHLQKILNAYVSWEVVLQKNIWITIGDNGQAWIDSDRNEALIDLRNMLGKYRIMKLRKGVQPKDQIVLAVNERMSYIYTLDTDTLPINKLVQELQNEKRIDVITWKEGETIKVKSGEKKGEFHFREGGGFIDKYNQTWFMEGDHRLLDFTLNGNQILYDSYPDALARIHSSLNSHEGNFIIISAKPGYEFIGEGSPTHVGGASHGGLHKQDTLVPLIVTGSQSTPTYLRMVDLKEWILSLIS